MLQPIANNWWSRKELNFSIGLHTRAP